MMKRKRSGGGGARGEHGKISSCQKRQARRVTGGERGCIRGTTKSLVWMEHSTLGGKGEARELGRNHKNRVLKIMMKA